MIVHDENPNMFLLEFAMRQMKIWYDSSVCYDDI